MGLLAMIILTKDSAFDPWRESNIPGHHYHAKNCIICDEPTKNGPRYCSTPCRREGTRQRRDYRIARVEENVKYGSNWRQAADDIDPSLEALIRLYERNGREVPADLLAAARVA